MQGALRSLLVVSGLLGTLLNAYASDLIGLRVFKLERVLEIWVAHSAAGPYRLKVSYPIAAMSGGLGPKRREGDMQVPEGFYWVNRFNPNSRFHLSLGLNYPNSSDRKLGNSVHPGSDIFIHGNHVSAGCIAMTDPIIEKIYRLVIQARDHGQHSIPVSVYPCRLNERNLNWLRSTYGDRPDLQHFWSSLIPGYVLFESTRKWVRPHVGRDGYYAWPRNAG